MGPSFRIVGKSSGARRYLFIVGKALEILGKGLMMGLGMIGPAIGIGLVGNAFMNAVGRNPEASKFLGQILVIIGIIVGAIVGIGQIMGGLNEGSSWRTFLTILTLLLMAALAITFWKTWKEQTTD